MSFDLTPLEQDDGLPVFSVIATVHGDNHPIPARHKKYTNRMFSRDLTLEFNELFRLPDPVRNITIIGVKFGSPWGFDIFIKAPHKDYIVNHLWNALDGHLLPVTRYNTVVTLSYGTIDYSKDHAKPTPCERKRKATSSPPRVDSPPSPSPTSHYQSHHEPVIPDVYVPPADATPPSTPPNARPAPSVRTPPVHRKRQRLDSEAPNDNNDDEERFIPKGYHAEDPFGGGGQSDNDVGGSSSSQHAGQKRGHSHLTEAFMGSDEVGKGKKRPKLVQSFLEVQEEVGTEGSTSSQPVPRQATPTTSSSATTGTSNPAIRPPQYQMALDTQCPFFQTSDDPSESDSVDPPSDLGKGKAPMYNDLDLDDMHLPSKSSSTSSSSSSSSLTTTEPHSIPPQHNTADLPSPSPASSPLTITVTESMINPETQHNAAAPSSASWSSSTVSTIPASVVPEANGKETEQDGEQPGSPTDDVEGETEAPASEQDERVEVDVEGADEELEQTVPLAEKRPSVCVFL
ncbi:hypothetical protein HDV00_008882 [Rhizophlyctis rosea]|nr:hypothetical protein HDV00_008882 [Rhizophlyctis rosea]